MTREEAEKVGRMIGYADSACSTCVRNLIEIANVAFPEWRFSMGDTIERLWDDNADGEEPETLDGFWPNQGRIEVLVSPST